MGGSLATVHSTCSSPRSFRPFSSEGQRLVLQSKLSLDRAATALSESVPTSTCCNSSSGETLRLWNADLALKCAKLWMTKYGESCNNFVAPCLAILDYFRP